MVSFCGFIFFVIYIEENNVDMEKYDLEVGGSVTWQPLSACGTSLLHRREFIPFVVTMTSLTSQTCLIHTQDEEHDLLSVL